METFFAKRTSVTVNPPAHRSGRRLGPPGSASARTWSRAGCWFVALRATGRSAPCPRQRAAPRTIACPTTVVPRHSRQPRARLAARGGPGRERAAAQARAHPRSSDLRSQDAKSLGSSAISASQLGVGGVFAVFGGAQSHAGGESGPRMGKAFACHTGLTSVASQHSAGPRGEAP